MSAKGAGAPSPRKRPVEAASTLEGRARIAAELLERVVLASAWVCGAFVDDDLQQVIAGASAHHSRDLGLACTRELARLRARSPRGDVADLCDHRLAAYSSGISAMVTRRGRSTVLLLLRSASEPPFTPTDVLLVEHGLDFVADILFGIPRDQAHDATALPRRDTAMFVLNDRYEIVLASRPGRFPAKLDAAVREVTAGWNEESTEGVTLFPAPFLALRIQPLRGSNGERLIAAVIERTRRARSIQDAAQRYAISDRESQILALIIEGARTAEIAGRLHISVSTVRDHVKNLLRKTGSHTRSEAIARVLSSRDDRVNNPK